MRVFLDSSAWIEYLDGSSEGEKVSQILNGDNEIFSIPIIISEVISRAKRRKQDIDIPFRAITINSRVLETNSEIARDAGIFHADMKKKKRDFGLVDSFIWVVAKKLNAKLVTCDPHFKNFKNVFLLK